MNYEEQYAAFGITDELRAKFSSMENEYMPNTSSTLVITKTVIINSNRTSKVREEKKNA